MLNSPLALPAVAALALLAGCSAPPIPLQPLPDLSVLTKECGPIDPGLSKDDVQVALLEARQAPEDLDLSTTIKIEREQLDEEALNEEVTFKRNHEIPDEARVVISVPVEEQIEQQRREDAQLANRSTHPANRDRTESDLAEQAIERSNSDSNNFQTNSYFNRAEQQIKKSLIGKGFRVQDRSKFEAKLRNLRSEDRGVVRSPEKEAETKILSEQKESGEISSEDYIRELMKIEKRYARERKDSGRSAGSRELTDIAELIRAAQEGEVQADYILQVNRFHTDQLSDKSVFLLDEPEIRDLTQRNPGLGEALSSQGKSMMTQPGFYGVLNAELIEVQSGVITWIGEHRVESLRVFEDGYRIVLPIIRRIANSDAINNAIEEHNHDLKQAQEALAADRKRVMQAAAAESAQHNLALQQSHQQLAAAKLQVTQTAEVDRRNLLATKYNEAIAGFSRFASQQAQPSADLRTMADSYNKAAAAFNQRSHQQPPAATRTAWVYDYVIGSPSTRPRLPTANFRELSSGDRQEQLRYGEFLNSHFSELAKRVAKELIKTIPSK